MGRKSECRGCDQGSGKEFDSAAQKQPAEDSGYSTTDSSVVP